MLEFTPEQRNIFVYEDGSVAEDGTMRGVRGDPIAIYRGLCEAAGNEKEFASLWDRAHARDAPPEALLMEQARLAEVVRTAFRLLPLDPAGPGGLTEEEQLRVLYEFADFQSKKRQRTEKSRSSSPRTPASGQRAGT